MSRTNPLATTSGPGCSEEEKEFERVTSLWGFVCMCTRVYMCSVCEGVWGYMWGLWCTRV